MSVFRVYNPAGRASSVLQRAADDREPAAAGPRGLAGAAAREDKPPSQDDAETCTRDTLMNFLPKYIYYAMRCAEHAMMTMESSEKCN